MPLGFQIAVVNSKGFSRLRGGVTCSQTPGEIRVLQADHPRSQFIATFSAPTIIDPLTGFNVVDFDVPVSRKFAIVRFNGNMVFVPGLADTFELGAYFLEVAKP